MRKRIAEFIVDVEPYATGSFRDCEGGWTYRDQALRSLHEACLYVDEWIAYRLNNKGEQSNGGHAHPPTEPPRSQP